MGYTKAEAITLPIVLTVIVISGLILNLTLGHRSDRVRKIPLMVIGITLLVLEIVKQFYHLVLARDWKPWYLPVHFCSFLLVWIVIATFARGKFQQLVYSCCLSGGILMTILLTAAPRMIIHEACENPFLNFDRWHTWVFHFSVVAYWVWLLFLGVYQPQGKHLWQTTLFYAIYYIFLLIMANLLHTNYTNALYADLAALENIRVNAGQPVYLLIMFAIGVGGIALMTTISYLIHQVFKRKDVVRY